MTVPPLTDLLVLRYLREVQEAVDGGASAAPPIEHAWQAAAYQRLIAYSIRHGGYDASALARVGPEAVADLVLGARCVLWPDRETVLALEAPLPDHVVGAPERPQGPQLWVYASDLRADDAVIPAMLIDPYEDGLSVVLLVVDADESVQLTPTAVRWGTRWPDDVLEGWRPVLHQVLRMWWYVQSPRVEERELVDDRGLRRRLRRWGIAHDAVHVVHYGGTAAPGGGEPGVRTHWVAGHYRAQWYPRIDAHRVIWVDPYLRGDGPTDDDPPPAARTVRRV